MIVLKTILFSGVVPVVYGFVSVLFLLVSLNIVFWILLNIYSLGV